MEVERLGDTKLGIEDEVSEDGIGLEQGTMRERPCLFRRSIVGRRGTVTASLRILIDISVAGRIVLKATSGSGVLE